ncbi:MAG: hypothetical protein HOQ13_12820 [Dermatophilaceae bacterium]|nr:hypothetical protein [Dermatophilaceae bacterium]NUR78856.1 hypothetical protein [Dermatophilaceae bacterium]
MSRGRHTHPASASRIVVSGLSVAGTVLAVTAIHHDGRAEAVEKASHKAAEMTAWNAAQAAYEKKVKAAAAKPRVVTKVVHKKVYVSAGSGGATGSVVGASSGSSGSSGASGSSGSSPAPAAAPKAAAAPAAPPPPATTSAGS